MKRRHFSAFAAGAALVLGLPRRATAQGDAPAIAAARDFTTIDPPVPVTAAPGTVDVVEFFSFACPHCFAFETPLQAWLPRKSPAIRLRRSPVPFQRNFRNFQPMWFALEALGLADTLPRAIFDAVHLERQRLDTPAQIAAFVTRHGVDADAFMHAFASPDTAAKVAQADRLFDASGAGSVPTLMVQGRFLTSPWMARGGAKALAVVDALVERVASTGWDVARGGNLRRAARTKTGDNALFPPAAGGSSTERQRFSSLKGFACNAATSPHSPPPRWDWA